MQPKTIECDNLRGDGAPCRDLALVHMVHYIYAMEQRPGHPDGAHVLRATNYDIQCPRCGRRLQTVTHD